MGRKTRAQFLAELRSIARERGGRLLSRAYAGDTTKLLFRCDQGHEWEAAPGKIKQDRWCPACGRTRTGARKRARAEARLRRLVARRGGAILSTTYVSSQTKLRFRCDQGHEWEAVPASLLMGTWCPTCAVAGRETTRRQRILNRLRRRARRRGGEILTPTFEGSHVPMLVRCARRHEWRALPTSIGQGVWCPTCKEESWLAQVRAKAEKRGGRCLSERCRGWADRMLLECAQGHRWRSPASQVKQSKWCPKCLLSVPHDLERMRAVARERGGECLSDEYVDSATRLRWTCAEGHEWEAAPNSVVQGVWCRVCRRGQGRSRRSLDIETMQEMARDRGGACLSKRYSGIYSRLRWRCAAGHEWVTVANNVRRGGWCPRCSHSILGTLERMRALAVERGGRCLSRSWNDHRRPLLFECAAGHRFRLRSNVVKTGVWCPECPRRRHP